MVDPRDEAAARLEAIADELELTAGLCRTGALRFRERLPPRAAAHAFAAYGHLHRATAWLGEEAEAFAGHAQPSNTPAGDADHRRTPRTACIHLDSEEESMKIVWVSSVAPIVQDMAASRAFYLDSLGLPLGEGDYPMTDQLPGVKHFGLWTLAGAAESCFGTATWPLYLPVPQASVEFEVEDAEAVAAACAELQAAGDRVLVGPKAEPWGQTVARLLSPEGLLIGISYTPWQHEPARGKDDG